jgi:hypothetical protein
VSVHNQICSPGLDDWSLIDMGRGYHLRAPNLTSEYYHPSHPVFSTAL